MAFLLVSRAIRFESITFQCIRNDATKCTQRRVDSLYRGMVSSNTEKCTKTTSHYNFQHTGIGNAFVFFDFVSFYDEKFGFAFECVHGIFIRLSAMLTINNL